MSTRLTPERENLTDHIARWFTELYQVPGARTFARHALKAVENLVAHIERAHAAELDAVTRERDAAMKALQSVYGRLNTALRERDEARELYEANHG